MSKISPLLLIAGILSGCATEQARDPEAAEIMRNLAIMKQIIDQNNQQQAHQRQERDHQAGALQAQEQHRIMREQQEHIFIQQMQQQQMQQQMLQQQIIHQQVMHHHHTPRF